MKLNNLLSFIILSNKNLLLKKVSLKNKLNGFQEKSRSSRYNFLYNFSKKRSIENIFLGHHLDDLNESFFMRKIQQSGTIGLSNIFSKKYKNLKLHRPLNKYTKKQIKRYADRNKLIWFEDRTNQELEFTRNKIRYFLYSYKYFSKINKERLIFSKAAHIRSLYKNFFKSKKNQIFEIDTEKFNNLTENLKLLVIQSFYYENRYLFKKQIRVENIRNFIKILNSNIQNGKEKSIFSGKISVLDKKTYLNLT